MKINTLTHDEQINSKVQDVGQYLLGTQFIVMDKNVVETRNRTLTSESYFRVKLEEREF